MNQNGFYYSANIPRFTGNLQSVNVVRLTHITANSAPLNMPLNSNVVKLINRIMYFKPRRSQYPSLSTKTAVHDMLDLCDNLTLFKSGDHFVHQRVHLFIKQGTR